jgi:hypothetical protein
VTVFSAIATKLDNVVFKFGPSKLSDFLPPRSSQNQKLNRSPNGPANFLGRLPNPSQFSVGKNPFAFPLCPRLGQVHHWVRINVAASYAPNEKAVKVGVNPASYYRGAAVNDAIQDVRDISTINVADQAMLPYRRYI